MERMVRLKAPADIAGVDYGGKYWPVQDGHVVIPDGAGIRLRDFGFTFPADPVPIMVKKTTATLHVKHGNR